MKEWKKPIIEHQKITKFAYLVEYPEELTMGTNVDIGVFTYINAHFGVEIQDDVEIGPHCSILSHSSIGNKEGRVAIKKGAKIGAYTLIMPGVTVGKNSLVSAYSYIDKDVSDNKIIKKID
jgi:acetyltransferase-like isoleucine patch superfamily enzyme